MPSNLATARVRCRRRWRPSPCPCEGGVVFEDATGYERFMGRWSALLAPALLEPNDSAFQDVDGRIDGEALLAC